MRRADLSPSGRSAAKARMLTGAAVTALTRTSVCALGRHPRGPRTASGAFSSHIGRSEERSHPRLHRLPIDDQAAIARSSGSMTSSSPPPLRSLREIVPLPTINRKAGRAGFLQPFAPGFFRVTGWLLATANLQDVSPTQLRPEGQLGRPRIGWTIVVMLFIVLVIGVVLWLLTLIPGPI